tara:strand:+ start:386 stop:730 length:345 start_codon:yes stop_codon:yes gene_type:complete
MKPIVIKNSIVPRLFSWFFPVSAITIFPFIFAADEEPEDWLLRHEEIHFKQYLELLIIGFLLVYTWDFLRGYWRHRNFADAYHGIRFEQESYQNESNPNYLKERKKYAWRKYEV